MAQLTTSDLTNQLRKHFEKDLLEHAVQELRLNEYAMQKDLPKNAGTKEIQFARKREANQENVQNLTEGDPSALTIHEMGYEYVSVALAQYGDVYEQSDVAGMVALYNLIQDTIGTMGEEAALKADSVARDEIVGNVSAAGQKRYAQGLADFASLAGATNSAGALIGKDVAKAATQLKINRAPRFGGDYVAIIPPQGSYDFMEDTDWKDVGKYTVPDQIFKGELGRWKSVRFVEATNPYIESSAAAEGTYVASGNIFTTIFLGKCAFGVPKLAGTSSPWKPQVIVNMQPDKSDPLNQKTQLGYKLYWAAKLLNQKFAVTMRHRTTFS